jgi:ferredoxin-NADP reductase
VLNDTALPATLTALHVALAMLRRHRANGRIASPFVLPSFVFPAAPWLWTSSTGLVVTSIAHLAWVVVCELVAPAPSPSQSSTASAPGAASVGPIAGSQRAPARPPATGFWSTPVLAVLDETSEIKTFRLARPEGFAFTAGQFVPVRIRVNGHPHVRCYSISSGPDTRGYIEISVRRHGLVSCTLHALLKPGSSVSLGRPAGRFVYPTDDDRPLALIAGGIGITPLLSMLRHAVSSDPTRPVTLLYSARSEHEVAFLSDLRAIAERHPQVRLAITLTQPCGETRWRVGRVNASLVRQYVADPGHTIFCLCGPTAMVADLGAALRDLGVDPDDLRSEQFETAVAASVLNETATRALPHQVAPPASDGFQVTFARSGRSTTCQSSTTLLDIAEAEGIPIPSSCRAGVCQACRTRVAGGDVDCRSDMLAADDREAGFVLPCVSWARTDCTLEA